MMGLLKSTRFYRDPGAGAVGSEYACTFGALGTKVHLIDSRDVLLPFLDSVSAR